MLWINTDFLWINIIYRNNLITSSCLLAEAESMFRKIWQNFPPFRILILSSVFFADFLKWTSFFFFFFEVDFLRRHFRGFLNLDDKMSHKFPGKSTKHAFILWFSEFHQSATTVSFTKTQKRLARASQERFSFPRTDAISLKGNRTNSYFANFVQWRPSALCRWASWLAAAWPEPSFTSVHLHSAHSALPSFRCPYFLALRDPNWQKLGGSTARS